ncbi:MAG: periplasmic heavy metal sensor [Clostridiales bacterium]|nr:periplasmic heavy metal sensor [Clostridiales bacterium]
MKRKILAFGLGLAVVINISALVTFAYHRFLRGEEKPAAPSVLTSTTSYENALCLTGEQKTCLKDLIASYDTEVKEIQSRLREKRRFLVEEIKKEALDPGSIERFIEEIGRLQAEIQKKAVLHLFQEKKLLTPEQKERFFKMLENHVCPREHGQDSKTDKHQDCLNSH